MPGLLNEMGAWMQTFGNRIQGVQFFVGGGGFGTIETDDAAELTKLISEHPFSVYSEVEVKPLVDPATAMGALEQAYA
jgi:hypothetical protein